MMNRALSQNLRCAFGMAFNITFMSDSDNKCKVKIKYTMTTFTECSVNARIGQTQNHKLEILMISSLS
jgi:metal-sulfur cluster biosynthetic enzyme